MPAQDPDRIDALLAAAPGISLGDALATLKDALLADPTLAPWERDALSELLGAVSLRQRCMNPPADLPTLLSTP